MLGNKIRENPVLFFLIIIIVASSLRAIFLTHYFKRPEVTFIDLFFYGVFAALSIAYIRHWFSESSLRERFKNPRSFSYVLQQTELQFPEKFKHVRYLFIWCYLIALFGILNIFLVEEHLHYAMIFFTLFLISIFFIRPHYKVYLEIIRETEIPLEKEPILARPSIFDATLKVTAFIKAACAYFGYTYAPPVENISVSGTVDTGRYYKIRMSYARVLPFVILSASALSAIVTVDTFIHADSADRNFSSRALTWLSTGGLVCTSKDTYYKFCVLQQLDVDPQTLCFPGTKIVDRYAVDMGIIEYNNTLEIDRKQRAFNALLQNCEGKEQDVDIVFKKPVSVHHTEWNKIRTQRAILAAENSREMERITSRLETRDYNPF